MSKFLKIMNGLTAKERAAFKRYLDYDAHGQAKLLALAKHIFDKIEDGEPVLDAKSLIGVESLSKRVAPLLTEMADYFSRFLAHNELDEVPGMVALFAQRQYKKRNLGWNKRQEKIAKKVLDSNGEDAHQYLMRYWLLRERVEAEVESRVRGKKLELESEMVMMNFFINRFFALVKAQHKTEKMALGQVKKEVPPVSGSAEKIEFVASEFTRQLLPEWKLLQFFNDLSEGKIDASSFAELLDDLVELEKEVSPSQWQDLWAHLHNSAVPLINQRAEGIGKTAMKMFELGLLNGVGKTEGGDLRSAFVKNFTEMACRMGQMERAQEILKDLEAKAMKPVHPIYDFCKAIIAFHNLEFSNARSLLNGLASNMGFSDLYFQTGTRFLDAKVCFEMGEFAAVGQRLTSLKQFIAENKHFPHYHRLIYQTRIRFFIRLLKLRTGNKPKPQRLILELQEKEIEDKGWLLKKAQELGVVQ